MTTRKFFYDDLGIKRIVRKRQFFIKNCENSENLYNFFSYYKYGTKENADIAYDFLISHNCEYQGGEYQLWDSKQYNQERLIKQIFINQESLDLSAEVCCLLSEIILLGKTGFYLCKE